MEIHRKMLNRTSFGSDWQAGMRVGFGSHEHRGGTNQLSVGKHRGSTIFSRFLKISEEEM